jgi:prohibitin 1
MMRTLFAMVLGVLLFLLTGCDAIAVVQPLEVGVVFNPFTGDLGEPLTSGTHLINPLTETITIYSIGEQELTLSAGSDGANDAVEVRFADGELGEVDVSLFYKLDPEMVNRVHVRWQHRYPEEFVNPTLRGVIRDIAALYTAEQMLNEIPDFLNDIQNGVRDALASEGFILDFLSIRNVVFSDEFTARIEEQLIATQNAALTATPGP